MTQNNTNRHQSINYFLINKQVLVSTLDSGHGTLHQFTPI